MAIYGPSLHKFVIYLCLLPRTHPIPYIPKVGTPPKKKSVPYQPRPRDPRGGPIEQGDVLCREMEEKERQRALARSTLQVRPMQCTYDLLVLQDEQSPNAPEVWEIIEPRPSRYEIAGVAMGAVALLLSAYVALTK